MVIVMRWKMNSWKTGISSRLGEWEVWSEEKPERGRCSCPKEGTESDKFLAVRVLRVENIIWKVMGVSLWRVEIFNGFNDSSSFIIIESCCQSPKAWRSDWQKNQQRNDGAFGNRGGCDKRLSFCYSSQQDWATVLEYKPEWTGWLTVKVSAGKNKEALDYIKKTIDGIAPGSLFVYEFLDDRLNMLTNRKTAWAKSFSSSLCLP